MPRNAAIASCSAARKSVTGRVDTIVGNEVRECVVSLVERVTGCVLIGKLRSRTVAATNGRVMQLIRSHRHLFTFSRLRSENNAAKPQINRCGNR